jgi:hypothetical protein
MFSFLRVLFWILVFMVILRFVLLLALFGAIVVAALFTQKLFLMAK